MKQILLSKQSDRFLVKIKKSDSKLFTQISEEIFFLQKNPINSKAKKIVGSLGLYRIRIGKYRAIYRFDETTIYILTIAKREDVYDFLKTRN